ncbi:MAG: RHS repeat-associated core domain-containing protein [Acidobacteriota bacterium]
MKLRWLVLLAVLWVPLLAFAQQDPIEARGFSAEKVYDYSGIDSVALFNGNLILALPIGSETPVAGGFSYGLTLSYNAKVWDLETRRIGDFELTEVYPNRQSNAGLGWTLSLGGALLSPNYTYAPGPWRFVGADGSESAFYQSLHVGETIGTGFLYSRDNSYLRLSAQGVTRRVEFPDGTIRTFEHEANGRWRLTRMEDRQGNWVKVDLAGSDWELEDRLGREHTVDFERSPMTQQWRVKSVNLQAFGGSRAIYNFHYQETAIERHCEDDQIPYPDGHSDPTGPNAMVDLLTRIDLPDGSSWEMPSYYSSCNQLGTTIASLPGAIRQLRAPTRGLIEWTYQNFTLLSRAPHVPESLADQETLAVETKRVLDSNGQCFDFDLGTQDCTWTYRQSRNQLNGDFGRQITVTSPAGDDTVHHFTEKPMFPNDPTAWEYGLPYRRGRSHGGRFLSQEIWDGRAGSGTLRRSIYVNYGRDKLKPFGNVRYTSDWYDSNRRLERQRTVYEADGNRTTDVASSDFDGLGHYRVVTTGGSSSLGPARTVTSAYNPSRGTYSYDAFSNNPLPGHSYSPWPTTSPWVLGTFTDTSVRQGASEVKAEYCFDAGTGFLRRSRQLAGTTRGTDDVVVVRNKDSFGKVTAERFYGGDLQSVGVFNPVCGLGVPAAAVYWIKHQYQHGQRSRSEYRKGNGSALTGAEHFFTLDQGIDASTGLVRHSKDPAGVRTDYSYDALGRLTAIQPTAGQGAWIEIDYLRSLPSRAGQVKVIHRPNGQTSGATLAQRHTFFDPWGRVWQDRELLPDGVWSEVETAYYPNGWKRSQSSRRTSDHGSSYPRTVYSGYDPFGRPRTLTLPDGNPIRFTYQGIRTLARTVEVATGTNGAETPSTTTETYDRYGRLTAVEEPSGNAGAEVTTSYFYDAADRLIEARTPRTGGHQVRRFQYDGRGFLLSETHPELGFSGNGTLFYREYDARGHAHRQWVGAAAGAFDLEFDFDRAERLLSIRESAGLRRFLKTFTYGIGTNSLDRSKGKTKTATRHNWFVPPWNPNGPEIDVSVTETYAYGGLGGRVSSRRTALSSLQSFTQGWTWDDLGNLRQVTFPRCTFFPCAGSDSVRAATSTYVQGSLTAVGGYPGVQATVSYHDNGMLQEVAHSGGITYFQARDPWGMRRPRSVGVRFNGLADPGLALAPGASADGLSYQYDGAGNVKALGDERYRYDSVSRLVEGVLGGGDRQTYGYDRFGNLGSITTTSGGSTSTRTPVASEVTNRLTGAGYDAAGNQLNWGVGTQGFAYEWDSLSKMKRARRNNGTQDDLYLYTADDERICTFRNAVQPIEETWTVRDLDGQVLRTWTNVGGSSGAWTHHEDYIYREGSLLASWRPQEGVRLQLLDHLGTPRLSVNANGQIPRLSVFFPFGEELGTVHLEERLKFTGHERDHHGTPGQDDDLDYMHARYCSPLNGRFLSVDPVGGSLKNPQSLNRYTYALNNPLKWVDPDGLLPASKQGRNAFQRAVDEIALFFQAALGEYLEGDENPEDEADQPDPGSMAAELEAEGIDSSALPSERLQLFRDAAVEAPSAVAAGALVTGFTLAEQATISRATAIVRPAGRLIGVAGSSKKIRFLPGGEKAAQKLFGRLSRGGSVVSRGPGRVTVKLAPGATVSYRAKSRSASGHSTINLDLPGLKVRKIKFLEN